MCRDWKKQKQLTRPEPNRPRGSLIFDGSGQDCRIGGHRLTAQCGLHRVENKHEVISY
jgi:hypothetical protein